MYLVYKRETKRSREDDGEMKTEEMNVVVEDKRQEEKISLWFVFLMVFLCFVLPILLMI